jgi:polysaccharide pyruvyl transferase WcaK-like protein
MKRAECAYVVRGEHSAAQLRGLLGRLDLYVSTRLHGYALAVGAGVPTVAVEFHPKMRGFAEELGVEDWVVPMRGISGAAVASVCGSMLADLTASRTRLNQHLHTVTERATAQLVAVLPPPLR